MYDFEIDMINEENSCKKLIYEKRENYDFTKEKNRIESFKSELKDILLIFSTKFLVGTFKWNIMNFNELNSNYVKYYLNFKSPFEIQEDHASILERKNKNGNNMINNVYFNEHSLIISKKNLKKSSIFFNFLFYKLYIFNKFK